MNKAKLFSLISNVLILANLLVGFFKVHWIIIALFILLHAGCRMAYLKAENERQTQNDNATQTTIAPPMVRNIASVITAVILAAALYGIGYGVASLL
ncbi:MAG: hypothetical protein Q4B88_01130 [Moraxella sp.]|nr:hypothetical protein [Moraxella sp.]